MFDSPAYRRSRNAYMAQCAFAYFVELLVSDVFLAKLLTSVGLSDMMIGIISSFISLAFVVQLASIFLVKIPLSTKKTVILFDTLSQIFFMLIYLIPFFPISAVWKKLLIMLSIMMAYVGRYLIFSICYKWANSYVDPTKRASYSATKEIVSLISGIVFTTVIGYIIDRYEAAGNLTGGFLLIAVAMLIINICNFVSLMMIKGDTQEEHEANNKSLKEVLAMVSHNKDFQNIVILSIIWESARYFTIGFMGSFKANDLVISVFVVQVINMVANLCRMAISKPFGRFSDKFSYAKGFEVGLMLAAASFLAVIFTTPSRWWLIIVHTVLYNASMAGIQQNNFNIVYSYVSADYITQAMSIKNCISGVCGFLASVVGSWVLQYVQSHGNTVFGMRIYAQQLLSVISFLMIVTAIVFTHRRISNRDVMRQ